MITNQETILLANISIPLHICKRLAPQIWVANNGLRNTYRISKNENLCSSVHCVNMIIA